MMQPTTQAAPLIAPPTSTKNRIGVMRFVTKWVLLLPVLFSLPGFFGCSSVGVDYKAPKVDEVEHWNVRLNNPVVREINNPDALKNWWTVFHDDQLNGLIQAAIEDNLDLQVAYRSLLAARATIKVTKADNNPSFNVSGSGQYSKTGSSDSSDQDSTNWSTGIDVSWQMDLFGINQRSIEAAIANAQSKEEATRDVLVSLLADLATNYINLRSIQHQLEIVEEDIRLKQELLDIAEKKYESGLSDASDVKEALSNLEYAKTTVYDLKISRKETTNRLAILVGKKPGTLEETLNEKNPIPTIPTEVITIMPTDMIRRRPDIREAERNLAVQTAKVGVAEGDKYPKFTLGGSLEYSSDSFGSLFDSSNGTLSAGPSFSWAIFNFDAIESNITVQTETRKKYLLDYQSTVLNALEEVENAMTAFHFEYLKNIQLKKAFDLASDAYDLALRKYEAGLSDYTDVVSAESSYISFKKEFIQSTANANIDIIDLYKAFGGGWETYNLEEEHES